MNTDNSPKNKKIEQFLQQLHQEEILNLSSNIDKNEGNISLKEFTYTAIYTTAKLKYRSAIVNYFNQENITVNYDSYSQELACLLSDELIESEKSDIPFVIYNRILHSKADKLDISVEKLPIEEVQKQIFKSAEFQTRVFVQAPDIKENKSKYEAFHVEIMHRMKATNIEKSSLEFFFLDDKINLDANRISPEFPIVPTSVIQKHLIQKWISIHNNKWYDMVKDHPEKVLKYGKII